MGTQIQPSLDAVRLVSPAGSPSVSSDRRSVKPGGVPHSIVRLKTDHSAVLICHPAGRRAQRRPRRAVGPSASARLFLDRSEHAGTLQQIDDAASALDSQHCIYRDGSRETGGPVHHFVAVREFGSANQASPSRISVKVCSRIRRSPPFGYNPVLRRRRLHAGCGQSSRRSFEMRPAGRLSRPIPGETTAESCRRAASAHARPTSHGAAARPSSAVGDLRRLLDSGSAAAAACPA